MSDIEFIQGLKYNHVHQIHSINLYGVFYLCLKKAGLLNADGKPVIAWPRKLIPLLLRQGKDILNEDYFYDRYRPCYKNVNEGKPHENFPITHVKLTTLLNYLEIKVDDFNSLNNILSTKLAERGFAIKTEEVIKSGTETVPAPIKVLYTVKPYGIFDVFRNPDEGVLSQLPNGYYFFEGSTKLYINSKDITSQIIKMPGLPGTTWVKVGYQENGKVKDAYFAQIEETDKAQIQITQPLAIIGLLQTSNK
jgi:hypothetical protein